jgi:hypothetical protein
MSRSSFARSPRWRAFTFSAAALMVALTSASLLFAQASPAPSRPARHAQILMLGTGTPIIDATHSGASDDDLLREVRSRYHGRVVSAHDLDMY